MCNITVLTYDYIDVSRKCKFRVYIEDKSNNKKRRIVGNYLINELDILVDLNL